MAQLKQIEQGTHQQQEILALVVSFPPQYIALRKADLKKDYEAILSTWPPALEAFRLMIGEVKFWEVSPNVRSYYTNMVNAFGWKPKPK